MGDTPGIAGSSAPEVDGIFLAESLEEADFFCWMGRERFRDGVDIWEIRLGHEEEVLNVRDDERFGERDGFLYFKGTIPASRLRLVTDHVQRLGVEATPEHEGQAEGSMISGGFTITTRGDGTQR
jgi:hypothetical protein